MAAGQILCSIMKKYDTYKPSGVEWLGEIPEHWETRRIKHLFKEINERSFDGSEDLLSVSQYTGVTNKSEKLEDGGMLTNASTLEGYKKVSKDDLVSNIMLAWNGSLGFSPFDGITSPAYSIYRLKTNDVNRYFHYLLRTELYKSEFKRNSSGVIESRLRLYTDDFFRIESILPPKEEQTAIANFLDDKTAKIDQAIAIKEQQIGLLKERKQIIIQEAVTKGVDKIVKLKESGVEWIGEIPEHWEVQRLKEICKAFGRIGFRGYTTADLVDEGEGAITISPSNIKEDKMIFEKCSYLSWHKYDESPEIQINNKDILIVKTGSTYGKVGIVKNLPEKATINPQLLVLKQIKIDQEYFYHYLKTSIVQTQIQTEVIGSTIPTISENKILNFKIAIPTDKIEIDKIVSYIETQSSKIDALISLKEQEIEKLKEYKVSLIDGVVTGKVRVC
jgi:type I restriction enzyme S subunit